MKNIFCKDDGQIGSATRGIQQKHTSKFLFYATNGNTCVKRSRSCVFSEVTGNNFQMNNWDSLESVKLLIQNH
jgi:hypothetical protein